VFYRSLHNPAVQKYVVNRCLTEDAISRIVCELNKIRWHDMYRMDNCNDQANFFYSNIHSVVDRVAPMEIIPVKSTDRPWATTYFKRLVGRRAVAFTCGNQALFRNLRNRVNRVSRSLKKQNYLDKIEQLKSGNPSHW
jgi:hypothetical protein